MRLEASEPALWLALVAATAGCSAIPVGGDAALVPGVRALASSGREPVGSLAVAPIDTTALALDEAAKGWTATDTPLLEASSIRDEVARGLAATKTWASVRLVGPKPRPTPGVGARPSCSLSSCGT